MLKPSRGMTLVELIVGIAIMSILIVMAVPNFVHWIGNTRIRTVAESLSVGLQITRANALKGNTLTHFQIMDNLGDGCKAIESGEAVRGGTNWVISRSNADGGCGASTFDVDADSRIIQKHDGKEGGGDRINVEVDASVLTFNGMGRLTTPPVSTGVFRISIYGTEGSDACVANGGEARCLRIDVYRGGNIRMCDPALPSTDARGCAS